MTTRGKQLTVEAVPRPFLHVLAFNTNQSTIMSDKEEPREPVDKEEEEEEVVTAEGGAAEHESEDEWDGHWPDQQTVKIIDLLRENRLIWDTEHKYYFRKDKKDAAKQAIAEEIGITGKCSCHIIAIYMAFNVDRSFAQVFISCGKMVVFVSVNSWLKPLLWAKLSGDDVKMGCICHCNEVRIW